MNNSFWSVISLTLFFAIPCYANQPVALASGKSIDFVSYEQVKSAQGEPTLEIKYNTATPLTDPLALQEEVDAAWDHFVPDVEKAGYSNAILNITNSSTVLHVIFQKQNGNWRKLDFSPGENIRLTENLVIDAMKRFDMAMEQKETNAALLYLGDNWTLTNTYEKNGVPISKIADRTEVAKSTSNEAQDYKHSRTIDNVTISKDGTSARVESHETESGTQKGHAFTIYEVSVYNTEVVNNSIVLTASSSDLSKKPHHRNDDPKINNISTFITCLIFGLFANWWSRRRLLRLELLKSLGIQTEGLITSSRLYLAIWGIGRRIRYKFQPSAGITKKGKVMLLSRKIPKDKEYTNGMKASILYLKDNPSVSVINDLLESTLTSARSYRKRVKIMFPVIVAISLLRIFLDYFG